MKILILCHEYFPVGGGAGKAAYYISLNLKKLGHKVIVMTSDYHNHPFKEIDGVDYYKIKGFRKNANENKIILTFTWFIAYGFFKSTKIIKNKRPDAIISFFSIPAGFLAYILYSFFKIPYIVSLRGSDVPYHTSSKLIKFLRPIIVKIWKNSLKVVVLSKGLLNTAFKTFPFENRFKIIYNGIDIPENNLIIENSHRKKIQIITVSRLHKNKGLDLLLECINIIRKNNDFSLSIVGDGPEMKNLVHQCKELLLEDIVKFHGYKPYDDVVLLLKESDFFVLPSRAEAFGQVFTEALSCGIPVIGTNTGGIPEIINENVGILVEVDSETELISAIEIMIKNSRKYNKEKLINYAKTFSWENVAEEYFKILSEQ